jgi:hypothetical protein
MYQKINITVPKPCHENWEVMTVVDKGRICASCQKKVIDFTNDSDRSIVNAFIENQKLCGRFLQTQVNRDLILTKEKSSLWLVTTSAIISLIGLGDFEAKAQDTIKTEQTDKKLPNISETSVEKDEIIVSGIVTDNIGPLPGATITIKGTKVSTQTDFDGKFRLIVKGKAILVFSFVGMETKELFVNKSITVNLEMKTNTVLMGEIIIHKKRTFLGRLFHKSKYRH